MRTPSRYDRAVPWIFLYAAASFVLHLLWENLHGPLYLVGPSPPDVWRLLFATATGDMIFMLVIYLALVSMHHDWVWVSKRESYTHVGTWMITIVFGALLGVSFELWAVHIDHRWTYAEAMPIIPILGIGLSPVLQMIVVPILVLLLCGKLARRA